MKNVQIVVVCLIYLLVYYYLKIVYQHNILQLYLIHLYKCNYLIGLIVEIPLTIYIIRLVRKTFTLKIDFISLIKYIIISVAVFGGIHLVMEEFLEYKNRIFEFLPVLMLFALIGVIGYLGLTYVSDKKTKILFNAVLHELINKIRK